MRKIFLIAFLLTSVAAFSQTAQFGDWYFRQRIGVNKPTNNLHPNSVFEVNDSSTSSLFRIYKNGAIQSFKFKNNSAEDSILTTDQFGNFKLRLKPSTVLPWDSITGKPSLLISGNNLADVSNVATARTNLSVYSIATVNDSLLNHFTKSQADARFKSIDWFPSVANVTGLPDSLTNLQARVQTKEPFISPGNSAQYWRGDKSWQTLDKSAVGLSAVPNVDATNPANISQSATYRFVTDSEKSTWNAKQNALGYTAENAANKATDFSTVNNTLYPTVQAVSNAISSATSSYIPLSQKGANNGVATLDVGGKVPFSQLPAALMIYKGTWNVSTNTPTLSDGTGVAGWVYIVSVGGTVNTGSGNITYSAGDYAIHNGSTWEKSAGTNNVASVNGQQGVVNLTTANISESGNLYYTDARARAALSFTPGSGGYNSSTGVITIPTNTNQLTNGAGFITGYTEIDPTIYAWAKAATKPSYEWSEITSKPTALSAFINDLGNYGGWITGITAGMVNAVGSITNSTTGNAATATNSTQWGGYTQNIGGGPYGGAPDYVSGFSGTVTQRYNAAAIQSFLGLGSYAYRSSGLAELSGATFTGGIIGTTSIFGGGNAYVYLNPISTVSQSVNNTVSNVVNNQFNGTSAHAKYVVATYGNSWYFGMGSNTSTYGNDFTFTVDASTVNTPALRLGVGGALTANSTITSTNSGVDGSYSDAFIARYSANYAETNAIQTAVSIDGTLSGFRFQASNGGGSSARTTVLTMTRDAATFNNKLIVGGILTLNAANGGGNAYHALNRNAITTENMLLWNTAGAAKWYMGQRSFGSEDGFSLFSTFAGTNVLYFTPAGIATFNASVTATHYTGSTASYSSSATMSSSITTAFCSGSGYTFILPSAVGVTGKIITVIYTGNLSGITISGANVSITLVCHASVILVSNGTNWSVAGLYQNSVPCS